MNLIGRRHLVLITISILCLLINSLRAQDGFKIYMIGDAGDHEETEGTLKNLQKELIKNPKSAVIFMGDNSYKDILWGIIPFGFKGFDSTKNTIDKIRSQLDVLNQYQGSAYFIPGNHDWWNRTTYEKGRPKLAMEESFIEKNLMQHSSIANPGKVFLPENGNYGPDFVELNHQSIRLIFIDTYRIIQTGIKKVKFLKKKALFTIAWIVLSGRGFFAKKKLLFLHITLFMTPALITGS